MSLRHMTMSSIGGLFLMLTLAWTATEAAGQSAAGKKSAQPKEFLTGADVSYWQEFEKKGAVYNQDGKPGDLPAIFKNAGCNTIRLRLWTRDPARPDPPPLNQLNDLDYLIPQARRIKKAGLNILLCMHYSDTWADPQKQTKPAAWKDLPFDQLVRQVHDYTFDVISTMKREGVLPEVVQIGNEITPGMLWPEGRLGKTTDTQSHARFAALLQAGIRGAREGAGGGPAPAIMIHVDGGQNWERVRGFFDLITGRGVTDFDMIGLSFYPYWGGTMDGLRRTLRNAAPRYHKEIVIVETAYPWDTLEFRKKAPAADKALFPMTPQGQRQFIEAVVAEVRRTPEGLGRGVIWWGADYLDPARFRGLSAGWLFKMALFDAQANALPALQALGRAGAAD